MVMRRFIEAGADRVIAADKLRKFKKLIKVGCWTSEGNLERRISRLDIQEVDLMWEHHLSDIVDCDIRKGGEGPDEPD